FIKTGLRLNHIDSHHHVHEWEPLKEVIIELAEEYRMPARYVDYLKNYPEHLLTETLWTGFYADGVHNEFFHDLEILDARAIEFMTHPAYIDHEVSQVSSYMEKRKVELDILTSLQVPKWVELIS